MTAPESVSERHYDRHVTVDHDRFDCALLLTVWQATGTDAAERRLVRIPVECIPDLIAQITQHGLNALSAAASRIEVGHCETCGNTGLVDAVAPGGRKSNAYCPDCRHRWPDQPFASAPQIGHTEATR